jgi:hypothetical protein
VSSIQKQRSDEPTIAFAVPRHDQPAIEIRVNFGIFAGREVTPAEIDHLAEWLLDDADAVTIVAEARHEISGQAEASVHQVRIELSADRVPGDELERKELEDRLVERADHWARQCIADRHGEIPDA